jgi:serine/threonine protein kinase
VDALFSEYTVLANFLPSLLGSSLPDLPPPTARPYGDHAFPSPDLKKLHAKKPGNPYASCASVRYLVTERLSPLPASPAPAALLAPLERVHDGGLVLCDVKPDNFLARGAEVVAIDLGLAERYRTPGGGHRELAGAGRCAGSSEYWSRR